MRGIDGKTAIVTGASTGIGAASAKRFAEEGANVVAADINVEDGEATVADIEAAGGEATFVETDVADQGDVEEMVETAVDTYGSLELAHNNAGISLESDLVPDTPTERWDRTIAVNQRGVYLCLKAEIPHILEAGGGAITNTASLAGLWAADGASPYVTAKHGVVGLTKTTALEYADQGIRVNALCPGLTATPMTAGRRDGFGRDITAMDRASDPAEQAAMAVWLCSEEASFVTGVPLPVDGGSLNGRP